MKWVQVDDGEAVDSEIVEGLISMLDETNQFVKKFRYARDRFKEQPIRDLKIKLKVSRSESGRENIIGPSDEVACVMVGDIDTTVGERDIIVEKKPNENERDIIMEKSEKKLERISSVHPSLMALQYPILLPFGEDDGYHDEIPYVDSETQTKKKRKRITIKEYYSYRLQVRKNEGIYIRLAGRLYQQYVVDAFSCIEQARLWWLRTHQTNLRSDLYSTLAKKVVNGGTDAANVVMYVVEFQKRGLPHVHMLIWLDGDSKRNLTANIDKYVTAEIPDPITDPVAYDAFTYDEIPQYYVWNETDRIWTMRKKGNQIGRLLYTHHSAGELWYLRLFLSNVRGPTSFDALKTINGVCCRTFKEACKQLGLLDDDNEWHSVLKYCSNGGFPEQIRQLFMHIIVNCQVTDLKKLWEQH
ncbi:uncharacterized protein LOC141661187 [Apium graveolens]|uniref:uncharacterized protein LOC141661187 n=1 Tax=Apium graveolens TaxID=4045 RepID=UPI003D7B856A